MRWKALSVAAMLAALLLGGCIYKGNDFTQEEFESAVDSARIDLKGALDDALEDLDEELDWEELQEELDEALAEVDWAEELLDGQPNTGHNANKKLYILLREGMADIELDYQEFCQALHTADWERLSDLPEEAKPVREYILAQDKTILAGQQSPEGKDEFVTITVYDGGYLKMQLNTEHPHLHSLKLIPEKFLSCIYRLTQQDFEYLMGTMA